MYDTILVPTDGSPETREALEHALAIASDNDATVHALYVVDRRLYTAAEDDTKDEVLRSLEEEGDTAVSAVRHSVEDAGLECVTVRQEGIPHREILTYADEEAVDLVVVGTHGRTGPERVAALGSTTERVVQNGSVPVLVVDIES